MWKAQGNTMAEAARDEVLAQLSKLSVEQLTAICSTESVDIPLAKQGNKSSIAGLLLRFISSEIVEESQDGGLALFQRLVLQIQGMLPPQDTKVVKVEKGATATGGNIGGSSSSSNSNSLKPVGTQNADTNSVEEGNVRRTRVVHRLKEFKIDGKIAHGDSPMSFQNICYQINDGKDLEYSWKEITSAVIKAMKGGSSIRNYFESNPDMGEDEFLKMLESLLDEEEKDSAKLLTDMSSKVQGVNEKVQTYVLDMINLRKRIVKLSHEEENPLSEALVRKWCTHAILVGLRLDPIRLEMRTIMKDPMIEEHDLMNQVKQLVKMEKEHQAKTGYGENSNSSSSGGGNKKNGDVNLVQTDWGKNRERSSERNKGVSFAEESGRLQIDAGVLNAKLDLITNQMGECLEVIPAVRALENDVKELKKQMGERPDTRRRNTYDVKCEACLKTNSYCKHCTICGEGDHKRAKCPKNT